MTATSAAEAGFDGGASGSLPMRPGLHPSRQDCRAHS